MKTICKTFSLKSLFKRFVIGIYLQNINMKLSAYILISGPFISSSNGFSDRYLSFSNYFSTWHGFLTRFKTEFRTLLCTPPITGPHISLWGNGSTYYNIQNLWDLIILEMLLACFSTQTWIKSRNSGLIATGTDGLLLLSMPK